MNDRTRALREAADALTEHADKLRDLADKVGEEEGRSLELRAEEVIWSAEMVRGMIRNSLPDAAGPAGAELERQRATLIEAMSGVSKERWAAGWMTGLEWRLHAEGGIWETIGRSIGWPTGNYNRWTWVTWDEASVLFAAQKKAGYQP